MKQSHCNEVEFEKLGSEVCRLCLSKDQIFYARIGIKSYLRCENCDLVWMDPAHYLSSTEEIEHYKLHENIVEDPRYREFLGRILGPLERQLNPGSKGLDFGCGPGPALAKMLEESGHTVSLFDPIFENEVSVLEKVYDFVTATEVVEHLHNPREEFRQISSLLRPGGILALMTRFRPAKESFAEWHYHRDPTHIVFYTPKVFAYIAKEYNYKIEELVAPDIAIFKKL